ncbi:hypothetical protein ABZ897_55340 [Nonomuraea sp. NPDC046802]|uniref:hypothetical protein n=1 Tax=Nonomuraea sp. NPDC046802 TaxID=3154919 RepID=UPI0033D0BAD7
MPIDLHSGRILQGLLHQHRVTPQSLADLGLSGNSLLLLLDGAAPLRPRLVKRLAQMLSCSPDVLLQGLSGKQAETIRQNLEFADTALAQGRADDARIRYRRIVEDPKLGARPDLWQRAEVGLALAEEAVGDLPNAIDRLRHVLQDVAPLDTPLPPMAFEDREEIRHRVMIAMALCRCLREAGDITASIQVGECAFEREILGGWNNHCVELGATLLAAYIERGELGPCEALADQLLEQAAQLGTPRAMRAAAWNGATVASMTGDVDRVLALGEQALAANAQLDDPRSTGRLRARLATNLLRNTPSAYPQSRQMLVQAIEEMESSSASAVDQAYAELELARVDLLAGHPAEAARKAKEISDRHPSAENLVADALLLLSQAQRALDQPLAAAATLTAASGRLKRLAAPGRAVSALASGAAELEKRGEMAASVAAYQQALDMVDLS